jgi:hypothetical protein
MNTRIQEIFDYIVLHPNQTERQICDGVGLKKTPYSRQILMKLIEEGSIARVQDDTADRVTYVYFVQQTEPLNGFEP